MELKNGYKIMYDARNRVETEQHLPMSACKVLPSVNDAMLISYNNAGAYVDCKQFKLIYSDGTHLLGSVSGIPADNDVNIIIKSGNDIVFGEVIEAEVVAAAVAPRKAKKVVEEEENI